MARMTSSAITFDEPSQIAFSGDSRKYRGSGDSSTYPEPPRHSSASPTTEVVRLQTQNFDAATASRRNGVSERSTASASRRNSACGRLDLDREIGGHLLHQRLVRQPTAERRPAVEVMQRLGHSAARCTAAEPMTQSSRVMLTMSMMVRTPRPSSPMSQPAVPSNSTSDEALERLPSLSFRR